MNLDDEFDQFLSIGGLDGPTRIDPRTAVYAALDVETTGLNAAGGDRIVEIAVVRYDAEGRLVDEFATLVDPGCDPGPTWIHHITVDHLEGAPRFADIVGDVLRRLDGCVAVAHNAHFDSSFLASELRRCSIAVPPLPALCTLGLTHDLGHTLPNRRLGTVAAHYGIESLDAHTALDDARVTGRLLTAMLQAHSVSQLGFPTGWSPLPSREITATPRHRVTRLRRGERGWIANLLPKLPLVDDREVPTPVREAYLALLAAALEDGRIIGTEAKSLARLAGNAGLGAAQLERLHRNFLDALGAAALADGTLTDAERHDLDRVATLLALPDHFDQVDVTETAEVDVTAGTDEIAGSTGESTDDAPTYRVVLLDGPTDEPPTATPEPALPLAGLRVLALETSDTSRHHLVDLGATLALRVTAGLDCLIVSQSYFADRRVVRALELGVPVLPLSSAWRQLGVDEPTGDVTGDPDETVDEVIVDLRSGTHRDPDDAVMDALAAAMSTAWPEITPGWYEDPLARSNYRWWNGTDWTTSVSDGVNVDVEVDELRPNQQLEAAE